MIQEVKNFDEIAMPETLYKYRDWTNKWHKTILTQNEVYLAQPKSFEDECDCRVPIGYDLLTDKEIYTKGYSISLSIKENLNFSIKQHREFAENSIKSLRNKAYLEQFEIDNWEIFNKYFGVISLTTNPKRLEMWEKYSMGHTGVCIGFDGKQFLNRFGGGGQVIYEDKLPIIHPLDDYMKQSIRNIYTKLQKWDFEEEYRVHKLNLHVNNDDWRKVYIDSNLFREIIIGAKTEKRDREEIISICREQYPNADILQALFKGKELEFNRIEK